MTLNDRNVTLVDKSRYVRAIKTVFLLFTRRFNIWLRFRVYVTCDTSRLILGSEAAREKVLSPSQCIAGELCSVYNRSCVECSLTVLIVERGPWPGRGALTVTVVCYQSVAGPGRQPATAAAATILRRRRTINTDNRAAETRVTSVSLASAVDIIALQRPPCVPLHSTLSRSTSSTVGVALFIPSVLSIISSSTLPR